MLPISERHKQTEMDAVLQIAKKQWIPTTPNLEIKLGLYK